MRKFILLQILLLFISWSVTAKNLIRQSQATIVCGRIINQTNETPKVLLINGCDPLNDEGRFASRIDSSGFFYATFEMLWGHGFTINYDKQFINLYANPGDSIFLEIDAAKFHEHNKTALVFTGDNSQKNTEFSQAFNDLNGLTKLTCNDFTLPLAEFIKAFEADNNRINDSIFNYCKNRNISSETQKLLQDMSLFVLANYAIDYKGRNNREALEFFTQPVFDVYNPSRFANMMFLYHIEAFGRAILTNDSLFVGYAKNQDLNNLEKRGVELLSALPKSLTRDVLLYYLYKKLEGGSQEIGVNDFSNKAIHGKVLALRTIKNPKDLPQIKSGTGAFKWSQNNSIENIKNFNLENLIKEKYNGKVIYLDLWATWCGPCRAEMAPARELHKLFHDKDVVFVNICMKSAQKEWAKMVGNGEVEGENYFFDDDLSSEVAASLLSGGYPTYLFIGKDGKVRTRNAPRPSSIAQVSEVIDKLLIE